MNQDKPLFWKEYFVYESNLTLTASATGNNFQSQTIKMDTDADFELMKTTYVATNDKIKTKLQDDSLGRYLFKTPVDIKTIAGRNTLQMGMSNSFLPFIWPYPYTLNAGSTITLEGADYSGAVNVLRLAFHGAKIRSGQPPWLGNFKQVPMIYSFKGGAVTVSANNMAVATIEIDIDAHYLIQKITGIRTGAAIVVIKETGRGREWSSQALHIDNFLGNGAFPNILPAPRFLQRGSVLSFNLTDLSGQNNVIDITLIGVKLFSKG